MSLCFGRAVGSDGENAKGLGLDGDDFDGDICRIIHSQIFYRCIFIASSAAIASRINLGYKEVLAANGSCCN